MCRDVPPFYTGHEFPSTDLTQPRIIAYTDGSCPNNRVVSFDNPAGWGFALTLSHSPAQHPPTNPHWYQSWGPVKTNPTDIVHPLPGSNNTGELKAIIELFDYLLYYSPFPAIDQLTIFTDSQYVLSILQGDAVPITHHRLATVAQKYYTAIRCKYRTSLQKVSSHVGIPGNELADTLAKRGVHSRSSLGRFAPPTLQSLTPNGHARPLMSKTRCSKIFSPPTSRSSLFFPSPPKNLGSPLTLLRK